MEPLKRRRKRLTDEQVREIRAMHAANVRPQKAIAHRLGVSPACVSLIVRNLRHAVKL